MIIEIIIFLLTCLLAYYVYTYKSIHRFFNLRDVKFVPGVPIFGNVFRNAFGKSHYIEDMMKVYETYPDEKYVGFIEFTAPVLLIRDPELIKAITIKDFDHFTDHREIFSEETDPLFAASLVFMKGDKWRNMRTTLSPAFTTSKMKNLLPSIVDISNNIIDYLKERPSEIINIDDLVRRYTNDVIASAGFGITINSLVDKDNEFYRYGSNILNFSLAQNMLIIFNTQFPKLTKKLGLRLFHENVYRFFTNIVSKTMEYRKTENVERQDMIQLLMETSKGWTADELTSQVFIFFVAGFDTSASSIVMTIHELAVNPDIQEKLYQEVRHKNKLTFESINELKYLDCVINESLRKWCPAIFMDRTCVKTYQLPPSREGGQPYTLKPGDFIYNMVNCLQMDPKYFPNPEKFDPDRFSDENKHNITPYTFMPFGNGPRICVGMRFAMMEIKILLYQIVRNFKIVKTEKTSDPIELQPHTFSIKAKNGTWVKFEKRDTD